MQVFLVTGGAQYSGGDIDLDSTEVLEDIAGTWKETAPLPSARTQLRAASVDNNIFVFGENILYYIAILNISFHVIMFTMTIFTGGSYNWAPTKDILRYNRNHTWEKVGQMKEARGYHAVGVLEDVSQLCS